MHKSSRFVLLAAVAGLAMLTAACGGEGDSADSAAPESAGSTDTGTGSPGGSGTADTAGGPPDCSAFTDELLRKWALEKQTVLNLAMTSGRNLESMRESLGTPDPGTFRSLADAFDGLDTSTIETRETFDTPDVISDDLRKTADLLEEALAAGSNTGHPAWTALSEFYSQNFFVRHNSSISYYLDEAGCV